VKHYHIDIEELGQLWEAGWTVEDLSARYRCTETYIYWLRKKYGTRDRDLLF
jgi:Mor family transcriptional regulator